MITFGGIILGKILRGESVADFLPTLGTYFSAENSIFINHPGNRREEYWYLMLVNCYAFEIIRKSQPSSPEYTNMIKQSLDTLLGIAKTNNYDFNDQGFDFSAGTPFTNKDSYRQPDTIGAYSYLMLVGFEQSGDLKYLNEAVKAMGFYQSFQTNPWYEIPSGAMACQAAVKLNSMGFSFELNKIIGFTFDSKKGPMHTGKWGDAEVNGLMRGWRGYSREEASQTAYSLESLILLPFLLPIASYVSKEKAKLIAKYALHTAANARAFFGDLLSPEAQSLRNCRRMSRMKPCPVTKGQKPYAFGDFHTHKSVYGGSLALWWAALVEPTEHPYILKLNLSKTDFLNPGKPAFYLFYNPLAEAKEVTMNQNNRLYDVYKSEYVSSGIIVIPAGDVKVIYEMAKNNPIKNS
ncbi:hypothetical protein RCG23_03250 [Neobacillus sp. PS3-34]|uniref:hypothetical protein n=1 Tax=Neobacillus sp. PS3-34 TaxID=3070678 RepID=UPI0027E137BB|nr:hypothetical protein [Neobacillus sp. PS3-34]WML49128.1 hypothetical protein RCG23_03250 [Neobacillus sp. PS3-34]